eukprot:TRINITY_DN3476_c0_g4_i1.p1 TRINITY_DN3476_c0_g4~~TRINITY_DN3476_c0_g4_i1.p1  ORF type:complete len:359 (-),score=37.09 TRINITY_DN3476_c0_g4_i1:259-1335(-)
MEAPVLLQAPDPSPLFQTKSVKQLTQSANLTTLPSNYIYSHPETTLLDPTLSHQIPTIDFALLTTSTPDQRSQIVRDIGKACSEWGFFMVINHGLSERVREGMLDACRAFFDLTEEEKRECAEKHVLDPIRYGTSINATVDEVMSWRDFLKVVVHPNFHSPEKPTCFREVSLEYCTSIREIAKELLKGISESLGLEACYIEKALEMEVGLQILVANCYPRCPQPELAMGIPPHSDHGLLTILTQNEVGGLQVKHKGKWVIVNPLPYSFLVNIGDHIEILSNGKYKSVEHQAIVNSHSDRISIAMPHGPSLDALVAPAPQLVDNENNPPAYRGMKYREYLEFQQSNLLKGKSCLDRLRV